MAVITCWSVKAGSGTTVVAAALALAASATPTVVVDLDGDLVATLGIDEPRGQGLSDWFDDDATSPSELTALGLAVTATCDVVPSGTGRLPAGSPRWAELAAYMADDHRLWIVDAGADPAPPLLQRRAGARRVLVQRACYVALRRAQLRRPDTDAVVFVQEPGRALDARDVAAVIGAPITATVAVDPKIGRAIDAGTLPGGIPMRVLTALRPLTRFSARRGPGDPPQ